MVLVLYISIIIQSSNEETEIVKQLGQVIEPVLNPSSLDSKTNACNHYAILSLISGDIQQYYYLILNLTLEENKHINIMLMKRKKNVCVTLDMTEKRR